MPAVRQVIHTLSHPITEALDPALIGLIGCFLYWALGVVLVLVPLYWPLIGLR